MKGDKHESLKAIPGQLGGILDTDDWEFVLIGTYVGGFGVGGGGFTFGFRSRILMQYLIINFAGIGAGAGLAVGWDWGAHRSKHAFCTDVPWAPLKEWIKNPFSASNLCNASGRVTLGTISTPGKVGIGLASSLVITAHYADDETDVEGFLFDKATTHSFLDPNPQTGGIGGVMLWGKWLLREEVDPAQRTPDWTRPACNPQSLDPESAPPLPSFRDRDPIVTIDKRANSSSVPRNGGPRRSVRPL